MITKTKLNSQLLRLEKLANLCDYCLDRMFDPRHIEIKQSTWWYNYFLSQIREVLKYNPYVVTDDLNISILMKSSISQITNEIRKNKPTKIRFFH